MSSTTTTNVDNNGNTVAPSFWDKLTGHTGSHASSSTHSSSSTSSSSSSSYNTGSVGSVGTSGVVQKETIVKETTIEKPIVSSSSMSSSSYNNNVNSNSNYQYCDDHLSNRALAATCTKCITTTGPMATMSGSSIVDVNQTAQVHFVGQQTAATLQAESAGVQVQVPAQTITTTLPAKRVIVEVPERQVQVQVPGRTIQLENAPEVQVTTRPVIKAVENMSISSGVTTTGVVGSHSHVGSTGVVGSNTGVVGTTGTTHTGIVGRAENDLHRAEAAVERKL